MLAAPQRTWVKDLLFIATCAAGLGALVAAFVGPPRDAAAALRHRAPLPRAELEPVARALDDALGPSETPLAAPLLVARRLSLALTGTLPSLEELDSLERRIAASDQREALAWWVDTRLEDPRYADYFAERLARALVGTEDGALFLYRRRRFVSWLSDQLAKGRGWDAVASDMIAGVGLWTQQPETNFVTAAIPGEGNDPDPERLAGRFSRVFLGQRLDCAQCHDHPFETRWSQRDFQGLAAFFAPAEVSLRGLRDGEQTHSYLPRGAEDSERELQDPVAIDPAVPFELALLPAEGPPRERLARWLTTPDNPAFARATINRLWALLLGLPLVDPIDDIPLDAPLPPALELLALDFAAHGYDLRRSIRVIALSEAFRRASLPQNNDELGAEPSAESEPGPFQHPFSSFPLTRLRPEQVVGALLQAASVRTIDHETHALSRFVRAIQTGDFIERYGDAGLDELEAEGGTIPQRLLLLNGELLDDRTRDNLIANAATRISVLASSDARAVELAYLAVLTRRPNAAEAAHFETRLEGLEGEARNEALADLYWVLLNTAETAWNH